MGNKISNDANYNLSDAVTHVNNSDDPDYPYSIEVDSFADANIDKIYSQILDIEHVVLYKHIDTIMYVLSRKNQLADTNVTDYFLFRYRKEPVLQIQNTSAQMNKWLRNRNPEIFNCIVCDIDMIRKDLDPPGIFKGNYVPF